MAPLTNGTEPVSTILDLPAGIEYLHVPGACLEALFDANEDLARSVRTRSLRTRGEADDHHDLVHRLQLAMYEICANIVVHGYRICEERAVDPRVYRIHIVFTVAQQPLRLVIDLRDTGSSFDITAVPEPDVAEPQARGYGLYLVRQLLDEVVYEVEDSAVPPNGGCGSANHWRLTKFL